LLAQAAPLQDRADGLTVPAAPAAQGGTTMLDRALQVDTSAAQPNADLLPMARDGDSEARPATRRAALQMLPSRPAASAAAQAPTAPLEPAPQAGLLNDGGSRGGIGSPSELFGTGSPNSVVLPAESVRGSPSMGSRDGRSGEDIDIDPALRGRVREFLQFLRENRIWLLGGAAALAVAVAAAQAAGRRTGGSPERRARAEADAQQRAMAAAERRSKHTRHRSSRSK